MYPFNLDVFNVTRRLVFMSEVTFFVGENGTGKSTLLKAIALKCNIHIWRGLNRTRYENNPYEEALHRYIDINWSDGAVAGAFFASEIFRNFAQILDEWASLDPGVLRYFGHRSLMTQSHGQSHMSFFRSRFKLKGLYLLDEPENALSPRSQIHLLEVMKETGRSGNAQFIMATHSPILLAYPEATIYSFDHSPVKSIDYEDTEHFRIYRDFLNERSRYLDSSR
jgi:predicted ATPase